MAEFEIWGSAPKPARGMGPAAPFKTADFLILCRWRISLAAGLCCGLGYGLAKPGEPGGAMLAFGAAWLLGAACSAWNQAQEWRTDALMRRTAGRPIPLGKISGARAVGLGAALFLGALALLGDAGGVAGVLAGAAIAAVYNGVYTPLKRRSGFALLAGAAVGAAPVLLGWMLAGTAPGSPLPALVYGAAFLWQVPHFWLRVELDREDWLRAGFPLPPLRLEARGYRLVLGLWQTSFGASLLLLPVFPVWNSAGPRLGLALAGLAVLAAGLGALRKAGKGGKAARRNVSSSEVINACDGCLTAGEDRPQPSRRNAYGESLRSISSVICSKTVDAAMAALLLLLLADSLLYLT